MSDEAMLWTGLGVAVLAMAAVWKPVFRNRRIFFSCILFGLQPDWISFMRGQYLTDINRSNRLMLWFGTGLVCFLLTIGILFDLVAS